MDKNTNSRRKWLGLVVLSAGLMIVILDQTVLNVAIPSILHDFNTSLPSLQWVISGYSLVFASLLITFGRLGDLYGRRRLFILGAFLFGLGSFLASISASATSLFVGEALIEGIGAAMMLPSTLSIISSSFSGRERGAAFAVWGAVAGSAGAFGPLLGGYLTTYHSWRWAFRINVLVAPLAIIGTLLFINESRDQRGQQKLDPLGMITGSVGLFALVFALIESSRYGWFKPLADFTFGSWRWPFDVSINFVALLLSAWLLISFYLIERYKERHKSSPMFEFSLFKTPAFRWGIITTVILSLGEFGLIFVLPIFLQTAKHLSAVDAGRWILPLGLSAIVGAAMAGNISRRFGPKWLISIGMGLEAAGILYAALLFTPGETFGQLLPGLIIYGLGVGLATTQLVNVILHDISPDQAGSASGMNGTCRQVGSALGIAVIGAILSAQTLSAAKTGVASSNLPQPVKQQISSRLNSGGGDSFELASNNQTATSRQLDDIITEAVSTGSERAGLLASITVLVGALLSLLIPNIPVDEVAEPVKSKAAQGAPANPSV